jgi:hypothetical protein
MALSRAVRSRPWRRTSRTCVCLASPPAPTQPPPVVGRSSAWTRSVRTAGAREGEWAPMAAQRRGRAPRARGGRAWWRRAAVTHTRVVAAQVLGELVGDESLERFKQEYEKLHRCVRPECFCGEGLPSSGWERWRRAAALPFSGAAQRAAHPHTPPVPHPAQSAPRPIRTPPVLTPCANGSSAPQCAEEVA